MPGCLDALHLTYLLLCVGAPARRVFPDHLITTVRVRALFLDYLPASGFTVAVPGMSRSDWMLPGGSVFVKPLDRKAPGRSATQTMKDVEALNEFAPREPP